MLFITVGHHVHTSAELLIGNQWDELAELHGYTLLGSPGFGEPDDESSTFVCTGVVPIGPHGAQRISDLTPEAHGRFTLS